MDNTKTALAGLKGEVFLLTEQHKPFASAQIELLAAIDTCGSISKAAKQVGISYKTAWDRIDAMNNMSAQPLVVRSTGGAQGGGTLLTELGHKVISGFQALQDEHQKFIERLGDKLHNLNDVASFMRSESVKTSARNQFRGTVSNITLGTVNTEVELDIGTDQSIIAMITQESVEQLGLEKNSDVVALIKASSVILSTNTKVVTSARNKLVGTISRLLPGAVNTDVTLDIGGGKSVSAVITNISALELELEVGQAACALFKAPSVILLKDA
ncbi:TOBE domain-containing protein [Marinomonas lutimaris]|uniref:TOBE domain-containing protein n=1 Tax=Marinomonas lutimaris TaxID=2846746 RepID=UPI001CA502E1|nr:TOBE domain-containing protein [Marinomonas lutimaris]